MPAVAETEEREAVFLVELPREPWGAPERHDVAREIDRFREVFEEAVRGGWCACEFAVPFAGDEMHIYIAVPEEHGCAAAEKLGATWIGARVTKVSGAAGPAFRGECNAAGYFLLERDDSLHAKNIFLGGVTDVCGEVLKGLSCLRVVGEEAVIQVLLRPSGAGRKGNLWANARIGVSAATLIRAETVLENIAAGFLKRGFRLVRPRSTRQFLHNILRRAFNPAERVSLTASEAACLFHPPHALVEPRGVRWVRAREFPIPASMPSSGALIGEGVYRGEKTPIRLSHAERPLYILGESHNETSQALENLLIEDIAKGRELTFIDVRGDIAPRLLQWVPPRRAQGVWYVDASHRARPVGLNILERGAAAEDIAAIISYLLPLEVQGPLSERYIRNAVALLIEDAERDAATLIDVPRVLMDRRYRLEKLRRSKNASVSRFWEEEASAPEGERVLRELMPYMLAAWRDVVLSEYVRLIVGQARPGITAATAGGKKAVIVRLPAEQIGAASSSLLGMLWVAKAAGGALYVNGADNNLADFITRMLPRLGLRGIALGMSVHSPSRLSDRAKKAVCDPAASHIALRVQERDAEILAPLFAPRATKADLAHAERMHAYAHFTEKGKPLPAFKMKLLEGGAGRKEDRAVGNAIRECSREFWGSDLLRVEKEVTRRLSW